MEWSNRGEPVILVRRETVPDDIHGMWVSQGILTATGGMTSHAAVVGRQMGKPSIVGAGELQINEHGKSFTVKGKTVKEGDFVAFDGLTGEVKLAKVASQPSEILQVVAGKMKPAESPIYQRFNTLLGWTDKFRRLGVRANADQPDQAELAYAFGARGIGLCRTEHMFFGEGRIPIVQRMILADNEKDRRAALQQLLPMQRADFYGVFKGMHGTPVTIRTIDPPLHEFLPKREDLMVEIATMEVKGQKGKALDEKRKLLARVEQLHEFNPMLGHRGVRLGITYPEITEMQTRAIMEAACQVNKEGLKVVPEIMIPLVGDVRELRDQKVIVERVAAEVMKEQGIKIKYLVGTMIEVPRGALMADEVAKEAQFFSFGTNDLTQMTFGFSRDDVGKFLRVYQDRKILEKDPFASFDAAGTGQLVDMAVKKGRASRARSQAGHLRRARRRPGVDPLLPQGRARLRELRPVSHSGGAPGRGAGGAEREGRRLIRYFVHRGGRTEMVDRLDPAWLLPDSGVMVWADVARADRGRRRGAARRVRPARAAGRSGGASARPIRRSKVTARYLYIVLHGINFQAAEHTFETHETDFFLAPNFLVTIHDGQRRSIAHIGDLCARADHILAEGPVALLHRIVDTMVDHYRPEVDELEERLDEIEKAVSSSNPPRS